MLSPFASACLKKRLQSEGQVVVVDIRAGEGLKKGVQRVVHLEGRSKIKIGSAGWFEESHSP